MQKNFKKVIAVLLALALIITTLGAGIAAYFTGTDKKSDTYTIGEIDVEIVGDDDLYSVEKLTPNYEYEFARAVHNTGINDAYVFMAVTVPYRNIFIHDLDGVHEGAVALTPLFTYGTEGVAGVNSNWSPVTAGKFGDYDLENVDGIIRNHSGEIAAVRVNQTITYIYAYVGDGDTLARLAPDAVTPALFDTMKFVNASDTVADFNVENTVGQIKTQVFAIQCDNVLDMTGNNTDGSEAINAVWDVLNNATNDKELSENDELEAPEEDEDDYEREWGDGTVTFSLTNSDTGEGVSGVKMYLVDKSSSTYAFREPGRVVDVVISDENGEGAFDWIAEGDYKLVSPNFVLTEEADNLSITVDEPTAHYEFNGSMGWAGAIEGTLEWGTGRNAGVAEGVISFTFDEANYLEKVPEDIRTAMEAAAQGLADGSIDAHAAIN